jgi:signal transduction histidine kinase
MPLSRVRLRLAGWFSLAFLAGLLLLSLFLYDYTHRRNDARFTGTLAAQASDLIQAIQREYAEAPGSGLAGAARAAVEKWPTGPDGLAVYDANGARVATGGPARVTEGTPHSLPPVPWNARDVAGTGEHGIRLVRADGADPAMQVIMAGSLERPDEDTEALLLWLAISVPVTVLLSLVSGYLLSRRALMPIGDLERSIGAIGADQLDRRLLVHHAPDEIGRVAIQFNGLLERLESSQARNRRFLEEAAHQIRTPLTLVLGEAELALSAGGHSEASTDALRRVRLAATQMRRRVDELLLLARADAGERSPLTDQVELDGLALEVVDLMRARAHSLGRRLELGTMDAVSVTGSESLLREAVLELLENACRHGAQQTAVRLSVTAVNGAAVVDVSNGVSGAVEAPAPGHGLGLQVVDWIAVAHGGHVTRNSEPGKVSFALTIPRSAAPC